ncbi:hypothetical protein ACWEKT_40495 [Nocardia takedensis]
MGRNVRRPQRAAFRRRLEALDGRRLWPVLVAAGASPATRERWPTIGHLVYHILAVEHPGRKRPAADELFRLGSLARAEWPGLARFEDFTPFDPREVVLTRLGDRVVRLFPGSVERPVADVDRAHLVSEAVDDFLIDRLGFGIRHVLDVALSYADMAVAEFAPSWPDSVDDTDSLTVTDAEIAAATRLVEVATPAFLQQTAQHRAALDWLTCPVEQLPYEPSHPSSCFGRFLRVIPRWEPRVPVWLPVAYLPDTLGYCVQLLAAKARTISPDAREKFARLSADRIRRMLWHATSPTIVGPPDTSTGPAVSPQNYVQWLVPIGPHRALAVQMFSDLIVPSIDEQPAAVAAARTQSDDARLIRISLSSGTVRTELSELVPLLIFSSAAHMEFPHRLDAATLSLDDLRWIASSVDNDSDLFMFARDLCRDDLPPIIAWAGIDRWEWWLANGKSIVGSGISPGLSAIAPHQGSAEWARASRRSDLERALAELQLAGLRDTDVIETDRQGPEAVYRFATNSTVNPLGLFDGKHHRPPLFGWLIVIGAPPVAIRNACPDWERAHFTPLHDLAQALAFGFRQVQESWHTAHRDACTPGYRIELVDAETDVRAAELIWIHDITPSPGAPMTVTVRVASRALQAAAADNSHALHQRIADLIAQIASEGGVHAPLRADLVAAWKKMRPTLIANELHEPTARRRLKQPIDLDDSAKSVVDQAIARHLLSRRIAPGTFHGDEAKKLDTSVLAPAAHELLDQRIHRHAIDELVPYAMRELERCTAHHTRTQRDLVTAAADLKIEWDPIAVHTETNNRHLLLRRCIETVIEATIRTPPTGNRPIDRIDWIELLAAAHAYLEATMRSEQLHHQLNPTALTISDLYEIDVEADTARGLSATAAGAGTVYDLDSQRLAADRGRIMTGRTHGDDVLAPSDNLIDPQLDKALLSGYGTSGSDILTALYALAAWPLAPSDPDAISVDIETLRGYLREVTQFGTDATGTDRVATVTTFLTTTTSGLQQVPFRPWQARSRQRRLLVQPIASLDSDTVVVAPHYCLTSLSVFRRYFTQGQLPWSQPTPPPPVGKTLDSIRDSRNLAFERAVVERLREAGWSVIERVKPSDPQRLNVPALETEIDAVAGHPDSRTIWLLEAKDPAETFVAADTRRMLDTFYVDGKKKSYATQLGRKYNDLRNHADGVAQALGLPASAPTEPYVIKPLFVTRTPIAPGYVGGPYPFAVIDELLDYIRHRGNHTDG